MTVKDYRYWEPIVDIRVYRGFPEGLFPNVRDRMISFRLEDENKGLYDKAFLTLNNNDGRLFDIESLALGVVFKLTYGYAEALATPRLMQCRKLSGANRIGGLGIQSGSNTTAGGPVKLQLYSTLWNQNLSRALVTSANKVKARDLIIEEGSTTPSNAEKAARSFGFDDDQIHVEYLPDEPILNRNDIPAHASAAEWLTELAKRREWVFRTDAEGFHFHSPDFEYPFVDGDDIIDLTWFNGHPDVIEWNIEGDSNVPQNVQIVGGSIRKEIGVQHANISVKHKIALASIYRSQSANSISPDLLFSASNSVRAVDQAERFLWNAADKWKLKIKLVGNPRVRFGKKLNLRNFGPMVDGLWRVKKAVHTVDPDGVYFTEVDARRKYTGGGHDWISAQHAAKGTTGDPMLIYGRYKNVQKEVN